MMCVNEALAEVNNDWNRHGEELYWITIIGTPSATKPWGWQLDGHDLVISYFVLGDQVLMTPTFMASEPVIATAGRYAGTVVMQPEQDQSFAFLNAPDPAQRDKAIIRSDKTGNDAKTEAWKDNAIVPMDGLAARELTARQRDMMLDLMMVYIGYADEGHAPVNLAEVVKYIEATHLFWSAAPPPTVFSIIGFKVL